MEQKQTSDQFQAKEAETPLLNKMRGQFQFFGTASAVYALFFTFCLYKNYAGITFPFFAGATLWFFGSCMKKLSIPLKKDAPLYMAGVMLLSVAVFLTDNEWIIFMNYIAVMLLTLGFLLHHFYEDSGWDFVRYGTALATAAFGSLGCIGCYVSDFSRFRKEKGGKRSIILEVVLSLLAAGPLFLLVLVLLADADDVFARIIERMFANLFRLNDLIGCTLHFAAALLLSHGLIVFLCKKSSWKEAGEKRTGEPLFAIVAALVLAAVYVLFSVIQVVYLFFGKLELPKGITYAEYARKGFFQLLFVCLLNLAIVLICMYRFRESTVLKAVLTVICVCTYMIGASSAFRMILYMKAYYLTFLRLFVLWALAVLALLIAGVLTAVYRNKFPLFRYSMAVVAAMYILLSFSRPDYWIAKYNVSGLSGTKSTFFEREYTDFYYLSTLSMDAAPILLNADNYTRDGYNKVMQFGYGAKADSRIEGMGIRGFNVSLWIAKGM